MTFSLTNSFGLAYGVQSAISTDPSTWKILEPNAIKKFGREIKKVARRPISKLRSRRKGVVVDLDASVEIDGDLTGDSIADFIEGFCFSQFANVEFDLKLSGAPPTASSTGPVYNIDAASATLGGKAQWVTGSIASLFWAAGYSNSANNGLKQLRADLGSGNTTLQVTGSLVNETPPTNASLQLCGIRVLDDTDLTLTVSGSTATLVSAAAISDWSTLGLRAGMFLYIGSPSSTGTLQNALGAGGTTSYGFARVTSISGATVNLDKLASTLLTASGPSSASQDIMFGRFVRNLPTDATGTDNVFLQRYYQFEGAYKDLGGVGTDQYEYVKDCWSDQLALNLPLTDKGNATWSFIGTTADAVTSSRKSGASSAVSPLRTVGFGTSQDIASLSTDLISLASDVCFKSLTLTLKNNVSPEKGLGTLGARFLNAGLFEVSLQGQMCFTSAAILNAISSNTTTTFSAIVKNENGAVAFDIPEMTFGDGKRDFPLDKTILINLTADTHRGSTLTYDLGVSIFPIVPWA